MKRNRTKDPYCYYNDFIIDINIFTETLIFENSDGRQSMWCFSKKGWIKTFNWYLSMLHSKVSEYIGALIIKFQEPSLYLYRNA